MSNENEKQSASPVSDAVRAAYQAPPTAWDSESAAEAGRRSGEMRRRRASMTAEERALDTIDRNFDALVTEMVDAALGKRDFENLKLETRVTALQRLMEWKLGRPAAVKPKEDAPESAAPEKPDDLFE